VDQGWRNFIEGFEFSKADFSQGNKKSRMPTRLTRLLLKTQGIYFGCNREMIFSHIADKTIDASK